MDELHQNLARTIRKIAGQRGITLTHLADFSGTSRSHFWNILACRNSPTVSWLSAIAKALGVEPWELLKPEKERTLTNSKLKRMTSMT